MTHSALGDPRSLKKLRLERTAMDLSPFRQNFEKNRNRQKYLHSLKEHPKFTKIAKFGCEML